MTGPEHYREAEECLAGVRLGEHADGSPQFRTDEPETIAAAQVHATLALAAAIALGPGSNSELNNPIVSAWREVTS